MGSQSQILKQKNVPVTPHSENKLRKVTVSENTAASENHPCAKQQTVVSRNILAEPDSSADANVTTYTDLQDCLEVLN
jgi:hypothetical protein